MCRHQIFGKDAKEESHYDKQYWKYWTFLCTIMKNQSEIKKTIPFTIATKGVMPGASVRNSTHDKVMQQSSDGKADQTSGFSPGIS